MFGLSIWVVPISSTTLKSIVPPDPDLCCPPSKPPLLICCLIYFILFDLCFSVCVWLCVLRVLYKSLHFSANSMCNLHHDLVDYLSRIYSLKLLGNALSILTLALCNVMCFMEWSMFYCQKKKNIWVVTNTWVLGF